MRTDSTETAGVVAVMGRQQQISSAPVLRAAEVTTIMGRGELDLRKTTVAPSDEAEMEVFTLMGESAIRVPDGSNVDLRATRVMGGMGDRRTGARDVAGAPRIVIRGFIMWGASGSQVVMRHAGNFHMHMHHWFATHPDAAAHRRRLPDRLWHLAYARPPADRRRRDYTSLLADRAYRASAAGSWPSGG